MTAGGPAHAAPPRVLAAGRHRLFHHGAACGEERWRMLVTPTGLLAAGVQELGPPHPLPGREVWHAAFTERWRPTGFDVSWTVGPNEVRAAHAASGGMWRLRIEQGGQARRQEGDFPDFCEVEFPTVLTNTFLLARLDFAVGGEHEFPVLRIGPPLMAVSPEEMKVRCVEAGTREAPWGPARARRYVVSLPPRGEDEGYTFWADDDGIVLESYEGAEPRVPWTRLTELHREG